jgi:3-oxoacyl-[acyl-carrier protein] reductase
MDEYIGRGGQLEGKTAVVHGAGGALGGAVAIAFATAGAQVFLAGRNRDGVQKTADRMPVGSTWHVDEVNALDEGSVVTHAASVAGQAGRIDIVFNAISSYPKQGPSLLDIPVEDFLQPIVTLTSSQLITARAAAPYMEAGRGVILTLSASPARLAIPGTAGFGVACAAIEGMSRTLAAEVGPKGIRVVCIRPHRISDTLGATPDLPMPMTEFRALLENLTLTGALPTLDEVAHTAVFLASDSARAMTGSVANLTAGMSLD